MLPGFHAPENLLLAFLWQAVEVLQSLLVSLLALWRKPAKRWVSFERSFLFV
jgi:hypothetical protein